MSGATPHPTSALVRLTGSRPQIKPSVGRPGMSEVDAVVLGKTGIGGHTVRSFPEYGVAVAVDPVARRLYTYIQDKVPVHVIGLECPLPASLAAPDRVEFLSACVDEKFDVNWEISGMLVVNRDYLWVMDGDKKTSVLYVNWDTLPARAVADPAIAPSPRHRRLPDIPETYFRTAAYSNAVARGERGSLLDGYVKHKPCYDEYRKRSFWVAVAPGSASGLPHLEVVALRRTDRCEGAGLKTIDGDLILDHAARHSAPPRPVSCHGRFAANPLTPVEGKIWTHPGVPPFATYIDERDRAARSIDV